jgi:hypothetical protein
MRVSVLLALATCNALQGNTRPPTRLQSSTRLPTRLQSSQRPPTLRRARPDDCPEEVWERIVEAERNSREKKGQIGAALWGLDKGAIEQNQLRIWEELRERQESGAKPTKKRPEVEAPSNNPFAGVMKAFKDVYDEADAMGYAQAVALNKQLEDKGVLSKAKRKDDDDIQLPQERVVFEEPARKTVKRKRGKGAKPKSRKGSGFS